ncbi:MAG: carboxypeptidase regulatory-like domain-containing protein [Bacteroidales bacterium]|nr:carboxypeptidase regulatory-like domain-containing protein [Bacteroidales bacterium]
MKKLILLFFCFILSHFLPAQNTPWRTGEMEVKVFLSQENTASKLASLNFNGDIYQTYALGYLIPSEWELLKKEGFATEVLKPDLNSWSASFGDALVPSGYYTYNQIRNIADSLVTHYPGICKKVIYGYNSLMQELAALKISDNVLTDENEAEILLDGGIHGDEVGGSQNMIQLARDLCLGYGSDPQITGLVDNREIWLYYCVNPWGRDNMSRYNSASVDINRDYGYMWGGEGGSIGPFSQPETKALRKCQYENQFVSYTNYHSGTEIISYPWSYRLSPCPDKPSIENLAMVYSNASGYSSLPWGQGSIVMYLIQGSTKDFNYACMGSVAWSVEISMEKQPTDVQYYYNINKPAMLELIQHSGYGIQGVITDAITGKPVSAAIFTGLNYPVYSDPEVGDFHKYLVPGSYSLKVVANGYDPVTIDNVQVTDLQSTTVNIEMSPRTSQFLYRVISSRIPNFSAQNPGDEGYTAACIGPPDQVNYSLGRGGYIIVDMQDTIHDGEPGTFDITVYEGDSSPEGYTLYAGSTMDGPWTNVGFGTGTMSFDLQPYGVSEARYFMLLDDNNGSSNVNDAGFDFDAMSCLHPRVPDTVGHLSGRVYNAFTNEPIDSVFVMAGDSIVMTDSTGHYTMELIRGEREICAGLDGYRQECDSLTLMPGSQYELDFYLFPTVGVKPLKNDFLTSRIHPNPFTTDFTLQFTLKTPGLCRVDLLDLQGREIGQLFSQTLKSGKQILNFNKLEFQEIALKPGSYLLRLSTPEGQIINKVVKAL